MQWMRFAANNLRTLVLAALALAVLGCQVHTPGVEARGSRPRAEVALNEGWKFIRQDLPGAEAPRFDDSSWQPVSVPHTWNSRDGEDGGKNYYRGPGWYRRHLVVDRALAGRSLFLYF